MAFPDLLENPSRTILTGEGGKGASRFKHIIQCKSGRYRRLIPDELDLLQTFPKGWTDTGMTDGKLDVFQEGELGESERPNRSSRPSGYGEKALFMHLTPTDCDIFSYNHGPGSRRCHMSFFKRTGKPPQPEILHTESPRQGVHTLNEIKRYGLVKPHYQQDLNAKRVIDFVFLPEDKVLLLASMDGTYPYWASVTDIDDVETNTAVANTILFESFSSFARTYPKLSTLMDGRYRRRFYISGGDIKTPFDYGFSSEPDQVKYWGMHLANSISRHYYEIRTLCQLRELDGSYLAFLRSYLKMLETRSSDDDVRNYEDKRMLIKLLTSEDYLYVSSNEAIRSTYVEARQVISSLYNLYMSIVR